MLLTFPLDHFPGSRSVQAERFFNSRERQTYQTELAQKTQRRLTKHRHSLFTFCSYEGSPWHTNNAEHAIKALVALRRHVSGVSSAKGMQESLTRLSLCETCRYRGVSFLECLRSGETDVAAFAGARGHRRRRSGQRKLAKRSSGAESLAGDAPPLPR